MVWCKWAPRMESRVFPPQRCKVWCRDYCVRHVERQKVALGHNYNTSAKKHFAPSQPPLAIATCNHHLQSPLASTTCNHYLQSLPLQSQFAITSQQSCKCNLPPPPVSAACNHRLQSPSTGAICKYHLQSPSAPTANNHHLQPPLAITTSLFNTPACLMRH